MNVKWMSDPQYLAQVGHTLGAYSLVCTLAMFGVHWGVIGVVFIVGIWMAALKEFWFDIVYEKDSWADSTMDFGFYLLGGAMGAGLSALARHVR